MTQRPFHSPGPVDPLLDSVQLDRQTGGDRALAREVLTMFATELRRLSAELGQLSVAATPAAMHRLKGSARALGARQLTAAAATLEEVPDDASCRRALADAIVRTLQAVEAHGG